MSRGPRPDRGHLLPLGKANILRSGEHVSVIGYGRYIQMLATLADTLKKQGISVEVIDLRTVSPYDTETVLASVAKTGAAIIVHEAVKNFGPAAEISALIHERLFAKLRAPVQRFGASFAPVPFSKPLESASLPSLARIENAIRELSRAGA
jgi:pyruvate dehydrogenase E1 component beta subunit